MIEKQVIIDVKEYEELKEWAEVGHSATEAVKRVLESGNPNEECRTITLYKRENEKRAYTKIVICTNDEILKDMDEAFQNSIKSITDDQKYWEDSYWKLKGDLEKKINDQVEEYYNLPLWKRLFNRFKPWF